MNQKKKLDNLQRRSGKTVRLMRHAMSYLLSLFLVFQPLMLQAQEITAAQNAAEANRPGLGTAGNGVPLVNIVTPNASGLSHNRYDRFNVGQPGAILNNSDQKLERSQLGGLLQGNPNLADSGTASVILNEVAGSNRSLLEGTLEVHGDLANVILANPNGVTCNGCGFINTPRVTLSTGIPELDGTGSLANLLVERGDISIGSNGVGLDGVSVFDLVSRRISIGGPVNVLDELNLVAGRNSYAYQSGLIASLASDGNEPGVAIDSSLLGGMYAGRIRIVSTDRGAGVNTQGQMAANAHGMTITADGKLTLGNVRAEESITATSQSDSVQVTKTLFSEEAVVLEGANEITLDDNALAVSSGDVSLKAGTVSLGDDALVASGVNEDGTQNPVGDVIVEADQLNAGNGQLAAGDLLTVTASTINLDRATDDETDVLRSLGSIALNAENIFAQNARITSMGALDLKSSSSLELTNGLYSAAGNLLVEAAGVTTGADLNAEGTTTLRGTSGSFTNTGQIAGDEGLIVNAATTFQNEGDLFSVKSVDITSLGAATNTATGRIAGNEGVTLNVASLNNLGKIAAQGSELTVNTGGNLDNERGGELLGSSAGLNVDGTFTNKGKLDFANALTIKGYNDTRSIEIRNSPEGEIHSGSGYYFGKYFSNAGSLKTRVAELEIDVINDIRNFQLIEAKTTGTMRLNRRFLNFQLSSIVSGGALVITGHSGGHFDVLENIDSSSLINGGESLSIKAGLVRNKGELGSADGNLLVELTGNMDNTGVLYSGTSSVYALDGELTNTGADILAETDLTIKGLGSARAASIENSSGNIEAFSGDLTLAADTITNKRSVITFGKRSEPKESTSGSTTTTVVTTHDVIEQNSEASKMLAGGDITIDADTLNNNYSQIAANGNITITANTINNTGRDLMEKIMTTTTTTRIKEVCKGLFCLNPKKVPVTTTTSNETSSTYDSVFASIEAGGTLNAPNPSGYVTNESIRGGVGNAAEQIGLASGERALDSASVGGGGGPETLVNLNELDVPINSVLGRSVLFDVLAEPNAPFLVETRSRFIDPSEFLGSDFFLEQVGYNPDQTLRRFGDAYVETRLVSDQIFNLSGRRYLGNATDTRGMIQTLYENAVGAQQTVGLTFGVALTSDQVAQLTQDIIWLEERVVRGETVLVPRVYLSSSTLNNLNIASAQIRADRVDIQVATLTNSGDITGDNGLNVTAGTSVINQGGGLFSKSDIFIDGGTEFTNESGRVAGDNVTIRANEITNSTAKIRDYYSNGFADRQQQTASIQASGDLTLEAETPIVSVGGHFSSGGLTMIDAGQEVDFSALKIESEAKDEFKYGYSKRKSLTHQLVDIKTGTDLTIDSGKYVRLEGVKASSVGDIKITATGTPTETATETEEKTAAGDVDILAVQDEQSSDFKLKIKRSVPLIGNKTSISEESLLRETKGSEIKAGGSLTITSREKNINIGASRLESKKETILNAERGKLTLRTNTDADEERKESDEEEFLLWKKSNKGHEKETIKHVEIEAEGGLKINVGKEGIVVLYEETGDLNASIDQLAQSSPGLEWMAQLRDDPRVNWVGVKAKVKEWDYEGQGLSRAGALIVSLVVSAVSGGALSGVSATLAQGFGFAADGIVQAGLQLGMETLVDTTVKTLVINGGDIGETLDTLGSSEYVRSLASSMVATGITSHFGDIAGVNLPETAPLPQRVVQDLQRNLVRETINVSVATAIEGGSFNERIKNALRRAASSAIEESAGEMINQKLGSDKNVIKNFFESDETFDESLKEALVEVLDEAFVRSPEFAVRAVSECVVRSVASGSCGEFDKVVESALKATGDQEIEYGKDKLDEGLEKIRSAFTGDTEGESAPSDGKDASPNENVQIKNNN